VDRLNFVIGLTITLGSVLGGYAATGGYLGVLDQPFEFLIICGASTGIFIVANPLPTIKDAGKAIFEAITDRTPERRDYLDLLNALHALMRELRSHSRAEVEAHFDNPRASPVFSGFPRLLANEDLLSFVCDYGRLIIIGNAKTYEIEALMNDDIAMLAYDRYKPVHALRSIADSLPALGIIAAVLGVVHAMRSLDSSPEILGGLIGAALIGTFTGILLSYAVVGPIALKVWSVRQQQLRLFSLSKQSLLAFMNGAMPQVAIEFGRKMIPLRERPTIDTVESETIAGPPQIAVTTLAVA
jgi:chemotaxis protein MotA